MERSLETKEFTKNKIKNINKQIAIIEKGTRQGCPLSLSLFILALEFFATKIRQDSQIERLEIDGKEFKLSSYVDDVILSISNPLGSMQQLMEQIASLDAALALKLINQNPK